MARPTQPPVRPDGTPHFYGRRKTHKLRPHRQQLVESLLPRLRLDIGHEISLSECFDSGSENVELEIGFGAGEHLSALARANPDTNFIGCEPFINGVAALLADIEAFAIDNVRLFDDDARLLLPKIPAESISTIYVLYSDPWPKSRHHRRRFIQQDTLEMLARIARPKATFIFASDHMNYIAWTLAQVRRHGGWRWTAKGPDDWRMPPPDWVTTRYETKAIGKGDLPAYLVFQKR